MIDPAIPQHPSATLELSRPAGRTLARRAVLPVLMAVLIAAGGYIRLWVPGNPVPFTLQVAFVLLAAAVLSPRAAFSAVLLFTAAGLLGAPVFAGGTAGLAHLMGPTGGFLLGFLVAAPLQAWLLRDRRLGFARAALAMSAAVLTIHALGTLHLALYLGGSFGVAASATAQFLPLDLVKIAAVAAVVAGGSSWTRRAPAGH